MRFPAIAAAIAVAIAAAIVALSLIACSGPEQTPPGTGPVSTPVEAPAQATAAPQDAPRARKVSGNTLVETPDYTGVIFSEKNASEFGFLFDPASTPTWEPSLDEVARAEACIRRFLASAPQDPALRPYEVDDAAYVLENLESYRRQYVGIVVGGEKRVWVNAFVSDDRFANWTRAPVFVLDGGRDYWEIEYLPLTDECIQFHVHGEA